MKDNVGRVLRRLMYTPELYDWTLREMEDALVDPEHGTVARILLDEEMELRRGWSE